MKRKIFLISLIIITSCQKEISQKDKFIAFLKTMPDVKLPFYTNSAEELNVSLYPSSLYKEFFDENIHEILGKIKINDSICGIVYLIPGDILFPILITYNEQGKKIDTLEMVHLPGGSDGYNSNGSSYLVMNENMEIQITDTINTFERDSLTKIIESTRETKVVIEKYRVNYIGKIIAHD